MNHQKKDHQKNKRGTVLIIVLIAMSMLALSAYTFANLMLDHRRAAEGSNMRAQSDATVASAVDAMRAFLMQTEITQQQLGGTYDNPMFFAYQSVVNDPSPAFTSQFSVISTVLGDTSSPSYTRFGLVDESSKINLNQLVENEDSEDLSSTTLKLLALPGMTADIADAILDWIDTDGDKREYGAEFSEDYSAMEPPRTPADGPIHSLSELLLVRGVTVELLYGVDQNRNGQVDPEEATLAAAMDSLTGSSGDAVVAGSMDLGWSAYLTCYGRERNIDPEGNYRINVNQEDLEILYDRLVAIADEDTATFICAYRQFGPSTVQIDGETQEEDENATELAGGGIGPGAGGNDPFAGGPGGADEEDKPIEEVAGRTIDLTQPAEFEIESVADLFDVVVEIFFDGEEEVTLVRSPFAVGDVPDALDYMAMSDERAIAGRININQAPRPVLATLSDLETEAIDEILAVREQQNAIDFGRSHPIWILNEGIVDLETMRKIMPLLTAGGHVYSADIVASAGDGNAVRRVQVLLDATRPEVPQLIWKDKEFLGRGYTRQMLMNPETTVSSPTGR